uniref:Uncharacterized protein n=1 Tax=Rhizophora mucronata TaxID=61149 RepID=A0A2P2KID5_RHIMU
MKRLGLNTLPGSLVLILQVFLSRKEGFFGLLLLYLKNNLQFMWNMFLYRKNRATHLKKNLCKSTLPIIQAI